MFGLIEVLQGCGSLTMLGRDIQDDTKSRSAKVEAFLKPALFCALYNKFIDGILERA